MTDEEAKAALIIMRDNCLSAKDYDDQMRGIKHRALTAAIHAIENQAKYEKALMLASDYIQSQDICPCEDCLILSELEDDDEPQCYEEGCGIRLSEYFKRKAGLEVSGDDE